MSDLPTGWRRTTLGEVVEVLDHLRVPVSAKERAARAGDVPYYGAAGKVGSIDRPIFDEPLVLLGEDGVQFFDRSKRKAYLIDGPAWVNNHAHVLRVNEDCMDRRFLLHQLNMVDYRGHANGTTRLKLTQAAMRRLPLVHPGMDEQRRIVDVLEDHLSRLDAALQLVKAQQLRLSSMRSAHLVAMCKNITHAQTLAEISTSAGYGTSAKCVVGGAGPPVVRIPNLREGKIDLSDEKRAEAPNAVPASLWLAPGDLLVVRTNGSRSLIGRSGVVGGDVKASFASYLIRYCLDRRRVRPEWVQLMLETPASRRTLVLQP